MQLKLCSFLLVAHIICMISCGFLASSFMITAAKSLLMSPSSPTTTGGMFQNSGFWKNHGARNYSPSLFGAHALDENDFQNNNNGEIQQDGQPSSSQRQPPPLFVWDNVVPPDSRSILHKEASVSGLGHRIFRRGQATNTIERALDDILQQLSQEGTHDADDDMSATNDEELYVEYWARQEWRHIEAHADVDENLAKTQDADFAAKKVKERPGQNFKYPTKGHVLYLQVGSEVQGPTCLFPDRTSGGQLLEEGTPPDNDNHNVNNPNEVELVTVPAVPGRLLRFEGSILHAVPRPVDLWLLLFVSGTPKFEPEDEWGRSVILFNTWPESPLDVEQDDTSLSQKEQDECESEEMPTKLCDPRDEWKPLDIVGDATTAGVEGNGDSDFSKHTESAKIWLLGNERRRNHMYRTVKLMAPEDLRSALEEKDQVRRTILGQSS